MKPKNYTALYGAAAAALLGAMSGADAAGGTAGDPCVLITQLGGVFKTLRTLAFVGAAFCIAAWAWKFISDKEMHKEGKSLEELRLKGVALMIGFSLLFGVGMILQFLPGISGCTNVYTAFGA